MFIAFNTNLFLCSPYRSIFLLVVISRVCRESRTNTGTLIELYVHVIVSVEKLILKSCQFCSCVTDSWASFCVLTARGLFFVLKFQEAHVM